MTRRKLAASIFADIEGYTKLMQADEDKALRQQELFRKTIEEIVPEASGEIIQFYGDGCLLLFSSSVEASTAAVNMQRHFIELEIPVRIGIHMGDVLLKDGNAFGDSINVTSRVESMGQAGSVLVSSVVADHITNKSEFVLTSIGRHRFKNVAKPVEVFAVVEDGFTIPSGKGGKVERSPSSRSSLLWLLIFSLVSITAFFLLKGKSAPEARSKNELIIFPFETKGQSEYQYLGQAIPDLLSAKLEGVAEFSVVDPNALYTRLGGQGINRDLNHAENLANEFSADRYILGTANSLGDEMHLSASIYSSGQRVGNEIRVSGPVGTLTELIDELVRLTISQNFDLKGADIRKTGAMMTRNLEALKSFFAGETARRNYDISEAINHYEDAFSRDSSFTMALYRLVYMDNSVFGRIPDYNKIQLLRRDQHLLPDKYDRLASGMLHYLGKNWAKSLEVLSDLYQEYPNDLEVNLMMGETLFHFNRLRGKSQLDALPHFEKVAEHDPGNAEALSHLLRLYILSNDAAKVDSVRSHPLFGRVSLFAGDARLLMDDSTQYAQRILELASARSFVASGYLANCSNDDYLLDHFQIVHDIAKVKAPINYKAVESWELLLQGQDQDFVDATNQSLPFPIICYQAALMTVHPDIPAFINQQEDLRSGLQGSEELFLRLPFMSPANTSEGLFYLEVARDDRDAIDQFLQELEAKAKIDPDYTGYLTYMENMANGFLAFRAGQFDLAARHFATMDSLDLSLQQIQNQVYERPMVRFMRGDIALNSGKFDEALGWFENFVMQPATFGLVPWTYERRGRIYEMQDRPHEAITMYSKFIALYQNSESYYHEIVNDIITKRDNLVAQIN